MCRMMYIMAYRPCVLWKISILQAIILTRISSMPWRWSKSGSTGKYGDRAPAEKIGTALVQAADEILAGKWLDQFPVDPIQGGAGTSVNMNMNEVLCNRALEILGQPKGRYDIVSPNNHANMAQSTNDVFPTSMKVCLILKGKKIE